MRYWTYGEIKAKVQKDLGLEQDDQITPDEMLEYCNEAIDDVEAEIHTLYSDYFLSYFSANLVAGTSLYALPTNIYANKIRNVLYFYNSSDFYEIRRMNKKDSFLDVLATDETDANNDYRYLLINNSAELGVQMQIVPVPRDNISSGLRMWYIRNANRMIDDDSICDIPEFTNYVIQAMKVRCYEKDGDPRYNFAMDRKNELRELMVSTLSNMVDDGNTEIEKDLTFYEDMV